MNTACFQLQEHEPAGMVSLYIGVSKFGGCDLTVAAFMEYGRD